MKGICDLLLSTTHYIDGYNVFPVLLMSLLENFWWEKEQSKIYSYKAQSQIEFDEIVVHTAFKYESLFHYLRSRITVFCWGTVCNCTCEPAEDKGPEARQASLQVGCSKTSLGFGGSLFVLLEPAGSSQQKGEIYACFFFYVKIKTISIARTQKVLQRDVCKSKGLNEDGFKETLLDQRLLGNMNGDILNKAKSTAVIKTDNLLPIDPFPFLLIHLRAAVTNWLYLFYCHRCSVSRNLQWSNH